MSYVDPAGKPIGTRHGMLLEDDGDVAKRMEGRIVELPRACSQISSRALSIR